MKNKPPRKSTTKSKKVNSPLFYDEDDATADRFKLSSFLIHEDYKACADKLTKMEQADLKSLASAIKDTARAALQDQIEALKSASDAIINAWTCGIYLNMAKQQLQHGEFEQWFRANIDEKNLSLRTAQRYMKIARKYQSLDELIATNPSLRQAYTACLPLESTSSKNQEEDYNTIAKQQLLKSFASIENKLRRLYENKNKIRLDKATRNDLQAAKSEIDKLFKELIR